MNPLVNPLVKPLGHRGFAEVPHMGSALTGASPGWAEAAEQLVKRVTWDLGSEAVEFRASDRRVGWPCPRAPVDGSERLNQYIQKKRYN